MVSGYSKKVCHLISENICLAGFQSHGHLSRTRFIGKLTKSGEFGQLPISKNAYTDSKISFAFNSSQTHNLIFLLNCICKRYAVTSSWIKETKAQLKAQKTKPKPGQDGTIIRLDEWSDIK